MIGSMSCLFQTLYHVWFRPCIMSVLDLICLFQTLYHVCFRPNISVFVFLVPRVGYGWVIWPSICAFLYFCTHLTILPYDTLCRCYVFCIWNRIISAKSIMIILIIFFLFYGSFNMVWDFTLTVLVCYEVVLTIEWA